ncbi:MAG: molybdopterin oxidoreductase [Gammaproteobacteria bacterium]|nr:MAG: molybdopterin oxidoreductase [Gammaproteobacteria bacterium]
MTAELEALPGRGMGFYGLAGFFALALALGLGAAWYMEHHGHYVTGMNNQVVWGTPHVFAVFLILAASGALNAASAASVFNRAHFKPLAPLSGVLAIALLVGGLMVLVLDLGRPDRLIVAMTSYNFRSIFTWNVFLYTGFVLIVAVYLWTMLERRMNAYSRSAGTVAFLWRLVLTTGTGCIFGFLVARQAYDAALMAPLFVAMSFSFGWAIFVLVLLAAFHWSGRVLGDSLVSRLQQLQGIFVAVVLYFVTVYHLTNLYAAEHSAVERFLLFDGGVYTHLFWMGQIFFGSLVPLVIFFSSTTSGSRTWLSIGCILVILGGLSQMYVIIIGGQAFPLSIFPGKEIVESGFGDGVVAAYAPSLPEVLLGLGGVAAALLVLMFGLKILRVLPANLADTAD